MPQPILTVNQRIKLKKREEEKTLLDKQFPRKENEGKREKNLRNICFLQYLCMLLEAKLLLNFP